VRPLAERLGLEWRAFDLASAGAVRDGIRGMGAVLHAAGPFSRTSRPMVDACLGCGAHYLDITGEIAVFEAVAARASEAKAAGVMLLPGAGFDVVPSDCLAAHLHRRLPRASRLRLSIAGLGGVSRGTAATMIEGSARGTQVRRGGRLLELRRPPRRTVDFGSGPQPVLGVSWGDVATAWRSTGIPDIEVYFASTPRLERFAATPRALRRLAASRAGRWAFERLVARRMPAGPTPERRSRSRAVIVGEASDGSGASVGARLETPDPYTLTAWTAVEIARRAATGEAVAGYQTPSTAFGADFVLAFEGTARTDL
jgi:short subunit dehydrogenase-like uncharacterized protein